jgi:hypothetical protein
VLPPPTSSCPRVQLPMLQSVAYSSVVTSISPRSRCRALVAPPSPVCGTWARELRRQTKRQDLHVRELRQMASLAERDGAQRPSRVTAATHASLGRSPRSQWLSRSTSLLWWRSMALGDSMVVASSCNDDRTSQPLAAALLLPAVGPDGGIQKRPATATSVLPSSRV